MRPTYSAEAEAYREKVQAFLAEKLPAELGRASGTLEGERAQRVRQRVAQRPCTSAGYLAPGWPTEYGGAGLSRARAGDHRRGVRQGRRADRRPERRVRHPDARQHAAAVGHRRAEGALPAAHPVAARTRGARATREPNAGSDLGNLGCAAVLDGDQWVLNGQKIWTSAGHLADHIFTLARTDPDAPKHKGISFLLVDMRQPGIEVRPIKMISRRERVQRGLLHRRRLRRRTNVVGGVNNGWAVAMTLLGYERGEAAATDPDPLPGRARPAARAGQGARRDRRSRSSASGWRGATARSQIMRYIGMRTLTKFLARPPARARTAAISKLYWSEYHKVVTELAVDILGADALAPDGPPPVDGVPDRRCRRAEQLGESWVGTFLNARAGTIYAGSSQIQRNIIGEMVLGLPKEPRRRRSRRRR